METPHAIEGTLPRNQKATDMEIITMESAAYKELAAKIDLIAGYVRQNEEKKNEAAAEV